MSKAHEGHGGARITDPNGDRLGVLDCLPAWMAKVETPDVVLLHLGTNDSDESDFGEQGFFDMEKLLELVRGIAPKAHVVLSTLMWRDNATRYENIQAFNARLAGLVTLQRKRGQKISLVDMHAQVPGGEANFADGLHPNATGYGLMADAWLASIEAIYPDPQTLVEAAVDVVPSTDAYIESHGNRSLNLGCYMTSKSRIEVDFQYPNKPADGTVLFGPYNAAAKLSTVFWNIGGEFNWSYGDNGHHGINTGFKCDTYRHTAVIDVLHNELRVECDGHIQYKHTPTKDVGGVTITHNNDAIWPIVLFGATADAAGNGTQAVSARVFSVKIYENDELKHDFRPCVKGSDAGFLDKETGTFVSSDKDLIASSNSERIPDDPYIESDGTKTINTGYCMKHTGRIEVDFQYPTVPANNTILFGAWSGDAKLSAFLWNINSQYNLGCGDNGFKDHYTGIAPDTRRHTAVIDLLNKKVRLERNGRVQKELGVDALNNDAVWPTVLFGSTFNAAGDGNQRLKARIYSVKVYDNDVIEHEWVASVVNGVPMLVDKCGGPSLYHQDSLKNPNSPFKAGGAITSDAYVESDGTQVLNTGYYVTPESRIEVDFQPLNLKQGVIFYGAWWDSGIASNIRYCGWNNYNATTGACTMQNILGVHKVANQYKLGELDAKRHTSILDVKNNMCYLATGSVTNYMMSTSGAGVKSGDKSTVPMGVLSGMGTALQPDMASKSRVFEVRIYENEKLVHDFLPYKNGDEVGLRDVLTGALALKTTQGSVPKIGGCGFGPDHAAFYEEPVGGEVKMRGTTLSAFAPGAIGYQWYKDGEAIPGAVLSTLKVDWQKGAKPAAYSVKAIFDSFGTRIEKMSQCADVTMAPAGFKIIIR